MEHKGNNAGASSTIANNSDVDDVVPESPPPAHPTTQQELSSLRGPLGNHTIRAILQQQLSRRSDNSCLTRNSSDQGTNVHQLDDEAITNALDGSDGSTVLISPNSITVLPPSDMQTLPVETQNGRGFTRNQSVVRSATRQTQYMSGNGQRHLTMSQSRSFQSSRGRNNDAHSQRPPTYDSSSRDRANHAHNQRPPTNASSQPLRSGNTVFRGAFALNTLTQSYIDSVNRHNSIIRSYPDPIDLSSSGTSALDELLNAIPHIPPNDPDGLSSNTGQEERITNQRDSSTSARQEEGMVNQSDSSTSARQEEGMVNQSDSSTSARQEEGMVNQSDSSTSARQEEGMVNQSDSSSGVIAATEPLLLSSIDPTYPTPWLIEQLDLGPLPPPENRPPRRQIPNYGIRERMEQLIGNDMDARHRYIADQLQIGNFPDIQVWLDYIAPDFQLVDEDEDGSDVDDGNDDFTSNVYQSLTEPSNADESISDFRTTPKPKEKKKEEKQHPKEDPKDADKDDCGNDGLTCLICFGPWTSTGKHRLCCLKCGHLFGLECIVRWLKSKNSKNNCPICKVKCKKSDIRNLYATRLIAVDHGELEQVREQLNKEQDMRRNKDLQIARINMEKSAIAEENKRLQKQLVEAGITSGGAAAGSSGVKRHLDTTPYHQNAPKRSTGNTIHYTPRRWYKPLKRMTISNTGGCRILDFDPNLQQFAVSQPCPHTSFNNGYGIKRIDAELQSSLFILAHTNQIKDIKFSPHYRNQILSVGQEGSVKITDLSSTSTVVEYRTNRSAWSCCWDTGNDNYIYAGLSNNSYVQYDIRNTNEPLSTFEPQGDRSPLIALHHVKSNPEDFPGPNSGLLSGTLSGGPAFWQANNQSDHVKDFTPTLSARNNSWGQFAGLQYDAVSKHCLVTYRPAPSTSVFRRTRTSNHVLYAMNVDGNGVAFDCIDTYQGGDRNTNLTRNSIFSKADKSLVLATIDESKNHVKLNDTTYMREEKLKVDCRPFDCMPVTFDQNQVNKQFAVLSENALSIYES